MEIYYLERIMDIGEVAKNQDLRQQIFLCA